MSTSQARRFSDSMRCLDNDYGDPGMKIKRIRSAGNG